MTLQEFKAWFDGFIENIPKQPTLKQWARIKERVSEIDGVAVTERVYIDRWWQPFRPFYYSNGLAAFSDTTSYQSLGGISSDTVLLPNATAMYAAGQAEAASMEH